MIGALNAHISDGYIDLIFSRGNGSKAQLLSLFTKMEDGSYVNHRFIEYRKVRSFILEPAEHVGIMAVDGERIAAGPIQVECFRGMLTIMAPPQLNKI